jgi:hypothetical protein
MTWSLLARTADGVTMEMDMEGALLSGMGTRVTTKLLLAPDPAATSRPVKQAIVQAGSEPPVELAAGGPVQKFERPDPKTLVGNEVVRTPLGPVSTKHYRTVTAAGITDLWVNDSFFPLGIVKMSATAKAGTGPTRTTMFVKRRGQDAKPIITRPAKPPSMNLRAR